MRFDPVPSVLATALLATVGSAGAQTPDPPPGVPVGTSAPSINSIRPGTVAPGSTDVALTIYGTNFDESLGAIEVTWNGTALDGVEVSESHPRSRIHATVPGDELAALPSGTTAEVVVFQTVGGVPIASNAVGIGIGTPPDCDSVSVPEYLRPACGAALGDVPAIEMIPRHVWYPFAAVPAGGVARATHRDSAANPEAHTVTSTKVAATVPPIPGGSDPAFDISIGRDQTGYIRVPEDRAPGEVIPFWCTQHKTSMNPPYGGVLVQ